MILIIDNYDSFTFNLYQFIGEMNPDVKVVRNDAVSVEEIETMNISHILISPGPGYPKTAGISKEVIGTLGKKLPVLGVCLGHQAIGEVFGCHIVEASKMYHGKTSIIYHNERNLFQHIHDPIEAMRYHSLMIEESSVTKEIEVTAKTKENEIMGIKHKHYPIYGVQFHPESVMTQRGKDIIHNFLKM